MTLLIDIKILFIAILAAVVLGCVFGKVFDILLTKYYTRKYFKDVMKQIRIKYSCAVTQGRDLTDEEKDICKLYSERDIEGKVHCNECPLRKEPNDVQ